MLLTATAAAAARLHEGRPAHLRRLLRIRAVQIEADLRFCEDVLNSKLKLVPTTSQSNSRVSSAGDSEPWATRQQHQAQQAQHDGPAVTPQKQYLQLHQIHAKQAAAAAAVAPWTGPGAAPAGAGGGAAPTARTADELLDLLSSVPEGQPFEIDAGLLYSPQSSYNAGDLDSPGSYGGGGGGNDDGASGGCDTLNFSLPAYCGSTDGRQPLYVDLGQAATALSPLRGGGSRGRHAAAASWTQPLQQAAGQGDGWQSAPGVSAVDARPASAPLPWEAPSSSGGSRSARQLLLDEVKATAGSQHQGVAAAATEEEAAAAAAPTIAAAAAAVASPGDRLHRLAQPRTQLWQRCAERRVQEEQAELLECTFAPNTGRPPRGRAQQQRQLASGLAVEERLQLSQQGRAEALQRARSEREREALAACTFAPQVRRCSWFGRCLGVESLLPKKLNRAMPCCVSRRCAAGEPAGAPPGRGLRPHPAAPAAWGGAAAAARPARGGPPAAGERAAAAP